MNRKNLLIRMMFIMLVCSMAVTEGLLIMEGRWREAIPLHLCSISAIAAACLVCTGWQFLLNFLWYLGMPGAALALLFPAPASSICQTLLNTSYVVTHALILLIPVYRICLGMRPERGKTLQMLRTLLVLACIAAAANQALGTDFLFLALPPAGTPLERIFSLGYPIYWLTLLLLMLLCCMAMDGIAGKIFPESSE